MARISVVINTLNEGKNITAVVKSIKDFADEIVVVDMNSDDGTSQLAQSLGAKVFLFPRSGYVEPARNFAVEKTSGDWVFIIDADERATPWLLAKLRKIVKENKYDFVRIPRKNLIFGRWIKNSRWWPDYNIRFFKKGAVVWSDKIHSEPEAKGEGITLSPREKYALVHKNYSSVSDYLLRMDRYSTIQAEEKVKSGYQFTWPDLIQKPAAEFIGRFFAAKGFKDGIHGLVLAILQAFSEFTIYLKVWQSEKFKEVDFDLTDLTQEVKRVEKDFNYWQADMLLKSENRNWLSSLILKIKRRLKF